MCGVRLEDDPHVKRFVIVERRGLTSKYIGPERLLSFAVLMDELSGSTSEVLPGAARGWYPLEGRGVIPHEQVAFTRAGLFAGQAPVLEAVLRWNAVQARTRKTT